MLGLEIVVLLIFLVGVAIGYHIRGNSNNEDYINLIIERDTLRQRLEVAEKNDHRGPDGRYTGKSL